MIKVNMGLAELGVNRIQDYKDYYKAADQVMEQLHSYPGDPEALKQINEVNGIIMDENTRMNQYKYQGCIRTEELVELYCSAFIHKCAMDDTNRTQTERMESYAHLKDCRDNVATIVQGEGYPDRWIPSVPGFPEHSASTVSAGPHDSAEVVNEQEQAQVVMPDAPAYHRQKFWRKLKASTSQAYRRPLTLMQTKRMSSTVLRVS